MRKNAKSWENASKVEKVCQKIGQYIKVLKAGRVQESKMVKMCSKVEKIWEIMLTPEKVCQNLRKN